MNPRATQSAMDTFSWEIADWICNTQPTSTRMIGLTAGKKQPAKQPAKRTASKKTAKSPLTSGLSLSDP